MQRLHSHCHGGVGVLFQQRCGFFVDVEHCRGVENFHAVQRQTVFLGAVPDLLLVSDQRHRYAQFLHRLCAATNHFERCVVTAECVD